MYSHLYFDVLTHIVNCHSAADYSLVALRIPLGDRPPCEEIDVRKAEGLKDMVDLMKNCWEKFPFRRKRFRGNFKHFKGY